MCRGLTPTRESRRFLNRHMKPECLELTDVAVHRALGVTSC